MNAMQIVAEAFDPGQWNAYGWVPLADTDPRDGQSRLVFDWADAHLNLIGHTADEVPHTERGLVCEMLFRHRTHTQALMVLNCPAVVVVAPPTATFSTPRDAAQLRAFHLSPMDTFVLHQGTWHWGPFPVSDPEVRMLNVQGLRYAEDNDCCRLDVLKASTEVVI
jgi:ureidoglycolate hydrolase